jgi:hypothetical protein
MPKLVGFSRFAALLEEQISEKISRRILSGDQEMVVWWSIRAGVHVEPHSHANEQIVWMLKWSSASAANSGSAARATSWSFREVPSTRHGSAKTTEVINFFAPPRDDFLLGGKPAYMSEG